MGSTFSNLYARRCGAAVQRSSLKCGPSLRCSSEGPNRGRSQTSLVVCANPSAANRIHPGAHFHFRSSRIVQFFDSTYTVWHSWSRKRKRSQLETEKITKATTATSTANASQRTRRVLSAESDGKGRTQIFGAPVESNWRHRCDVNARSSAYLC